VLDKRIFSTLQNLQRLFLEEMPNAGRGERDTINFAFALLMLSSPLDSHRLNRVPDQARKDELGALSTGLETNLHTEDRGNMPVRQGPNTSPLSFYWDLPPITRVLLTAFAAVRAIQALNVLPVPQMMYLSWSVIFSHWQVASPTFRLVC